MRWFFQVFWIPIYRWWGLRHIRKVRRSRLDGLRLEVPPGVFHPGVYFSTPIFIKFLQTIDFQGKTALDVGTGSGALALFAAQKGATATALDINPLAVETARRNAAANGLALRVVESDLLDRLPAQQFDFVLINPPYYPRQPRNAAEHAFFAGENHEYFQKLFAQLPVFRHTGSRAWMIVSEDCDLAAIGALAGQHRQRLEVIFEKKKWGERLWVVEIGDLP